MVQEWYAAFKELGEEKGFDVKLLKYEATYQQGKPLPETGTLDGVEVNIPDTLKNVDVYFAMNKFSATKPLFEVAGAFAGGKGRVVSMFGVTPEMEGAMLADYGKIEKAANVLAYKMERAVGAEVTFSTGHTLYVDLRKRHTIVDVGKCQKPGDGINFPSGEAAKPPYEGEDEQIGKSMTYGELPIYDESTNETIVCRIDGNRVFEVVGSGQAALEIKRRLETVKNADNLAEFAFGLNENARSGDKVPVLEKEKALGAHYALGASTHFGGAVQSETHVDYVYTATTKIKPSVSLVYEDEIKEEIMKDGLYTINLFDK